MEQIKKVTKITIQKRIRLNIENYFLDAYALKKYKKPYEDCVDNGRNKVLDDINKLTKDMDVTKIGEVRLLIISELLGGESKKKIRSKYII
ncbi:MAG: hypothetical protein DRI86_00865 [Bacteroidetes bacterium]|nr:MAG: hypothetical protein DRI86_00865 [Bacteroidota bacterium]